MNWWLSHRCDPQARALADRHYSRQSIGAVGFVPPGRCLVLKTQPTDAYWVTSYPYAEFVKHAWAGSRICRMRTRRVVRAIHSSYCSNLPGKD